MSARLTGAFRHLIIGIVASTVVGVTVACSPAPAGPAPAAKDFVDSFADRDLDGAAGRTDDPGRALTSLRSAWTELHAESMTAAIGSTQVNGDTATANYTYTWHLPKNRVWTYSGQLQLGRRDGRWLVRWSGTDVHPKLGDNQKLELRTTDAPRARVNEHAGSDILVPGSVYAVTFDASKAQNLPQSAEALARVLHPIDNSLSPQSIAESATAAGGPYRVATLSEDRYNAIRVPLATIPGVLTSAQADLVPVDPKFAPDLLTQVKKKIIDDVDGKAGWSVRTVNPNGVVNDVLVDTAPQPASSVTISLDRMIQNSAQNAVNMRGPQTMMVVIKASTGQVLAVAQNQAADRQGPIATTGLFPPGSTFKIVTSAAAIDAGMATPDTMLACPGTVTIGDRTIPNYDKFALGVVRMAQAFAASCNTTFAKLASQMGPDSLHLMAARMGVGRDFTIVGLPNDTGSVPPTDNLTERTEDGFGQGKVLVTPFGMALVAATVAHGSTPTPQLISGMETTAKDTQAPLPPQVLGGLRQMMREVVTSGTAERIKDVGEVYGKTGEAEFSGGSHAWFVGYRGDLAFATLIVGGGSSDNAVAVTRQMFEGLPPGYD